MTATWPPIVDDELRRAFVMNEHIDVDDPATAAKLDRQRAFLVGDPDPGWVVVAGKPEIET